ncbi:MAG TPA: DUF885 domain-containing protein [Actinomycetes bacterium]|nr:DUF885 domain-containing protein [Actinomycetes bacterium]
MTDSGPLGELAERYFEVIMDASPFEATALGVPGWDAGVPDLSEAAEAATDRRLADLERRLDRIDTGLLEGRDRVTHAMLRRALRDRRAELAARWPELTVSATMSGIQTAVLGLVPKVALTTAGQADDYLERCRRLDRCLDQAGDRLRAGIAAGRTPPALGVRAAIAQLDAYLAGPLASDPLLTPAPPAEVDAGRWRDRLAEAVAGSVRPAMARYRALLRDQVLPSARPDDRCGLAYLPGGEAVYRSTVLQHTTADHDPEQIHRLGLDLVAGLAEEYRTLGARVLGTSDLEEIRARLRGDPELRFQTAAEILRSSRDALDRAVAALPGWFGRVPSVPCRVDEMSPYEAKDAVLGYYQLPSSDGSRPGVHWLNTSAPGTRTRYEYEALAFHESVPGHHLQFALAQEQQLPRFRRFGYVTAFSEGWALYTERLADEMGLYSGDLERFGMLSFDSWRACRLVVDTGMHQFGWSRDRAIDYLLANSALTRTNIENEVDRYVAMPGQALAYMVGRLELVRLRELAAGRLGARFDLRAFHDLVLGTGGVPLSVLAQEVDGFIAAAGARPDSGP